jgi:hypothetical protein
MTNKTKFRLENLANEGRVETPKINGIYVNEKIARYWERNYGDNTFCLINLRPLLCGCEVEEKEEESSSSCNPTYGCNVDFSTCNDHTTRCDSDYCPPLG